MKKVSLENTSLLDCVADSQRERIVITQSGRPVAVMMGLTTSNWRSARMRTFGR